LRILPVKIARSRHYGLGVNDLDFHQIEKQVGFFCVNLFLVYSTKNCNELTRSVVV
jgi:hypothetical protein